MAIVYLDSVTGSDADDGTTKALAKATFAGALAVLAAGDTLRVNAVHVDSNTGGQTLAWPGTDVNPNIVISIDWTPDTYLRASAAQLAKTGAGDILFTGSATHYGMYYRAGDDFSMVSGAAAYRCNDCTLELTGSASTFNIGSSVSGNVMYFVDTEVIFATGGDGFFPTGNAMLDFTWRNGPLNRSKYTQPGTVSANLFGGIGRSGVVKLSGVDLSDMNTNLFVGTGNGNQKMYVKNCVLNAAVALVGSTIAKPGSTFSMVGCDDTTGNKLYRTEIADYFGTTVTDDANYNNTGASDGTNNISWKMVSNASALEFHYPTKSHWIGGWIDSTGSKTFLIETNSENVTFQDDELWLELEFLDASTDTQTSGVSDRMTDADSTPANQANSVAAPTWTTPGITTEKKQQLSITATVNRAGPFRARVCLAKPSATVWIDPVVTIS